MRLTVDYLEDIQDSEKLQMVTKKVIERLLLAINDWPEPIWNLDDYEQEVYKLMGKEVNQYKLKDYISKIDYSQNAWEAESLSQLMEIYDFYTKEKKFKKILEEIRRDVLKI